MKNDDPRSRSTEGLHEHSCNHEELRAVPGILPSRPPGGHTSTFRRQEAPLEVKVRSVPPVRLAETEVFFGMVPKDEKAETCPPGREQMQLWVDEGVGVEAIELAEKPEWLEVELAESAEETPAVRFVLLPVEETGPFSGEVKVGLVTGAGRHEAAVRCYGIRSE